MTPGRLTGRGAQPPRCFLHSAALEMPLEAEPVRTESGTPQRKGMRAQQKHSLINKEHGHEASSKNV